MLFPQSGRAWLCALAACTSASADPLHAIGAGAFQHHDSGWIFPSQVGGFTRVGAPQDVDGSSDAVAHYARGVAAERIVVVVDLYPPDTAAAHAKLADAKAAIEQELPGTQWQDVSFHVATQRELVGIKTARTAGELQTALWFIDTGAWIVRIRAAAPRAADQTWQLLDDFVREQRWDSLGLALQSE